MRLFTRKWQILESIIILLSPFLAASLAKVIDISETQVTQTLEKLQAILKIPKDNIDLLRLHHTLFRDFLLNKDWCEKFWVDEKKVHENIIVDCIQLMSQTLKKDVCEMHVSENQVSQIKSSQIKECLPPEIQYAYLYWVQHLQRSGSQINNDDKAHRFLQVHLLHWLETFGWIDKISEGIRAILFLEAYVPVSDLLFIEV